MSESVVQELSTDKKNTNILGNRNFVLLWFASIVSGFALSFYLLAETWYVLRELKLPTSLGVIMMLTTIPRLLLMSVGGVLADRMKRSTIMFVSNGIKSLLVLTMILFVLNGGLNIWALGIFALLFGVLDAFFWPADSSILPTLVAKENLVRANSFLQTTNQLTFLIGPMLAGIILKFGSFSGIFTITALLLLIGCVLVKFIQEKKQKQTSQQSSAIADFKEGFRYIKSKPFLITIMTVSLFINFFLVGPINIGLPLLVDQSLKGNVMDLSYLESSLAVGMIIGAIVIGILNIQKRRPMIAMLFIGVLSVTTFFLSLIANVWQGVLVLIVVGFCLAMTNILTSSLIQEMTDSHIIGRVQSLMATASMGFIPLSLGTVSILISFHVSINQIIASSTIILMIFVLFIILKVKVIRHID